MNPQPRPQIDGDAGLSDGPGAPPGRAASTGGLSELKSLWAKLPKLGKVTTVAVPALIILITVVTMAGGGTTAGGGGARGAVTPGSREDAGQASERRPSSLFDDWVPAVCRPGTYYERGGAMLRGSDGDAFCQSMRGNPIIIGQYSERFKMNNDLAMFRNQGFATMTTSDGRLCVFISPSGTAALQPLTEFGFQLGTVR